MGALHHSNHVELDKHWSTLGDLSHQIENKTSKLSEVANKTLEAISLHFDAIEKVGVMLTCLTEN